MKNWSEVEDHIRRQWPQMRENLLRMEELDAQLRAAGITVPPMPPILAEALRLAKQ